MIEPYVSIIIPAKDEELSVEQLYGQISKELIKLSVAYEIIFVDDGSTDKTYDILAKLHNNDKKVKVIKLRGNFGKSVALQTGFELAAGEIILTMDADLQDDPKEIPSFLSKINQGYDLVSGWKKDRHDPLSKTVPSKIGNFATRILTGIKIHDLNCGFKA